MSLEISDYWISVALVTSCAFRFEGNSFGLVQLEFPALTVACFHLVIVEHPY